MFRSQQNKDRAAERALTGTKLRVRALETELALIRRTYVQRERIKWGDYQKRLERRREEMLENQRGR